MAAPRAVPPMTGPVVDTASVFSPTQKNTIEQFLFELHHAGGSQIAVLTIDSLDGEPIESYAIRVVDQWKLGTKEKDNGLLILVAKNDRQVRIEVGQGLEGSLPDAYANRIIDQVMIPAFRSGDFGGGIHTALFEILQKTDPQTYERIAEKHEHPTRSYRGQKPQPVHLTWLHWIFLVLGVWFFLFTGIGRTILFAMLLSGGGRRGGGGGGGWGGGGGGFSGGGASGRW